MRFAAALLVVVCLGGCDDSEPTAGPTESSARSAATTPLPTLAPQSGGDDALYQGVLTWGEDGDCIFGATAMLRHALVLPSGYASLADQHAVVNEDGEVVAREGDLVRLGGGYAPIEDGSVAGVDAGACPDGPAFLVQHPIEINQPDPAGEDALTVALHHCGVLPLEFADRLWEVPEEVTPFDGTNAPDIFVGRGTAELTPDDQTLLFTDASGITLTFVRDDGTDPACD